MAKLSNGDLDKKDAEIFNTVVNIVQKTIEEQAQLLGIPEMRLNIKKDTDNKDIPTSNDRKITIKVVK